MNTYEILIVTPLLISLLMLVSGQLLRNAIAIISVAVLGGVSIYNMVLSSGVMSVVLPHSLHQFFILLDTLVLFYFLWQGIVKKDLLVKVLAVVQIVLYGGVVYLAPKIAANDIVVDSLSSTMYLIINIVGGLIIVYALKYIESEEFGRLKKNSFIAMLFFFLSVMNFIVSTNNIEIFFLLFELTTLCSYVLIKFREDDLSIQNALRALWMNQIGGVAILIALLFAIMQYKSVYFDALIQNMNSLYLLPVVFLSLAAFVKGASIPFEKWLLGAMVAPTPVSAILHSATMVKIAPFLILKLSAAMSGFVSLWVTLIGTFVFFTASLLALDKDYFKEILGYSTIALLALMMAMAAMGTPEAYKAALMLIVFHAISKALLFLQAGVLEKNFHLKYVDDINGLVNYSPLVVFFIIIGFASLTLPPFGAFIGKFLAIESLAGEIAKNPLYVFALIFLALGSVFLTLLYFKVLTKLFVTDVDAKPQHVKISKFYSIPSFLLVALLLYGIYFSFEKELLGSLEIIISLILIAVVPVLFVTLFFKNAHRVKEYNCGEKDEVVLSMYYFQMPLKVHRYISIISLVAMSMLVLGVVSC